MIDQNTQVVGVQPRITAGRFSQILKDASSPAYAESPASYQAIVAEGIDPLFLLAIFQHESGMGRLGFGAANKSPGNTRTSLTGEGFPVQTVKGTFICYKNWTSGFKDLARRLASKDYVYAKAGAVTIGEILPIFAPASDQGNDPAGYIEAVVSLMNSWIGGGEGNVTLQIDDRSGQLAAGKSADRGGYSIKEIILHETSGNHDVRNAAPDLARQLDNATIKWFLFDDNSLSIHYLVGSENLNAPIYRLCPESQAAYHAVGNKGSVDGFSVDNHISIGIERMGQPWDNPGPNQTRAMCQLALDICQRHNLQPEQIISHASIQSDRTDGNTLLVAVRAYVKNGLVAAHTTDNAPPKPAPAPNGLPAGMVALANPNNLDIYKDAWSDPATGLIVLQPFAQFYRDNGGLDKFGKPTSGMYGSNGSQEQLFDKAHFKLVNGKVEVDMVDPNVIILNGFALGHGFKDYFDKNGGIKIFGLPLSEEFTDPKDNLTKQVFERYLLTYDGKEENIDWRIKGEDIGRQWLLSNSDRLNFID